MAIDLEKYKKLKDAADKAQTAADKAAGAFEAAMERLRERGVSTIKEARQLADKLQKAADAKEQEYHDALADFEREWGGRLGLEDTVEQPAD